MKRILFYLLTGCFASLAMTATAQGIILKTTSEILELTTSTTADIDYQINWADVVVATGGTPGSSEGKITTATTTTIVAAPAASTYRLIKSINIRNVHATDANTVTIKKDISATEYMLYTLSLPAGEMITYGDVTGWQLFDAHGKLKTVDLTKDVTGVTKFYRKTGTGADALGYWYCYAKDVGIPGAWAPGTPGVAGRATDGTDVANDAGALSFVDAGSGRARYLTQVDLTAPSAHSFIYMDILWVNSGLSVTTTTAQTVNSVALPPRDDNGTINGEGCMIGVLAVAALGNAATVSNSTISYTNSQGTAGRTATLSANVGGQFPATPLIGTVVWFDLQAGDTGVKSIENITLNTTLTSGTMSLIIARPLATGIVPTINIFMSNKLNNGSGIRLYDNSCIHLFYLATTTGAVLMASSVVTSER